MLPLQSNLSSQQRRLLKVFAQLDEQRRQAVQDFALFSLQQQKGQQNETGTIDKISEPLNIPRPKQESVVAAMRRLSETYPMIDKDRLLDRAAALMQAHILQGKAAAAVIDELELLFEEHYRAFRDQASP